MIYHGKYWMWLEKQCSMFKINIMKQVLWIFVQYNTIVGFGTHQIKVIISSHLLRQSFPFSAPFQNNSHELRLCHLITYTKY